jgi:hypothetical protein
MPWKTFISLGCSTQCTSLPVVAHVATRVCPRCNSCFAHVAVLCVEVTTRVCHVATGVFASFIRPKFTRIANVVGQAVTRVFPRCNPCCNTVPVVAMQGTDVSLSHDACQFSNAEIQLTSHADPSFMAPATTTSAKSHAWKQVTVGRSW